MSKLEDFVRENREEFDSHIPSDGIWENIARQLPLRVKERPFWATWFRPGIAASVVLLVALGYTIGKYGRSVAENQEALKLSPKYGAELVRFAGEVKVKKERMERLESGNPELARVFETDLGMLNENYEQLKNSLSRNPNQEEILKLMIQNLQWQQEMLDRQLKVLHEEKRNPLPRKNTEVKNRKNDKYNEIV